MSRVKGVVAICHHVSQRGGHDYSGRSDHVHFPAVRLLYHQGNLSQLQRCRPVTHTEIEIAFFIFFHFIFVYMISCLCAGVVHVCCTRVLYTCVQALYVVLPGLLDCNPFPVDSSEPCWKGGVGFPEPVRRVLQVCFCHIIDDN